MKCREVMDIIEKMCPVNSAMSWDNPGLIAGDGDTTVRSIMVSLDATDEVIDAAIASHVDMLVTHHPLIFGNISKVNTDDIVSISWAG